MFLQIHHLIDEHKCYEEVRKIRWPQGVHCPFCEAKWISYAAFILIKLNASATAVRPVANSLMI